MAHPSSRGRRARAQRFARKALAATATAVALVPAIARADEGAVGGGIFIGYHYGRRSELEWGLEAFGTNVTEGTGCSSKPRTGAGAFAQIAWLGFSTPRLTLGGHGGQEIERGLLGLTGELGATYRFGAEGGFGIHTGVVAETLFLNIAARYQILRNEAWVGGGVRVFGTYGMSGWCDAAVGRPLRTDDGLVSLQAPPSALHACSDNDGQRIEAVGRAFERDAQLEHASVPAFLQLAAELARLDAPRALIARALQAARDEQRHTELCTQLARRHLRACAQPVLPALVQRQAIPQQQSVVRLAIESWLDGCVAEGQAAEQAACAAAVAIDPEAKAALSSIARDEHRHAELAWAILRWALARGGDEAHEAVRALRDARAGDPSAVAEHEGLEAHGILSARALRALGAEHLERSQRRLDVLLHG